MAKKKLNLEAKTTAELWYQEAVNGATKWFPIFALLVGVLLTALHYYGPMGDLDPMALAGPVWLVMAFVHYERYQARKAIERLLEEKASEGNKNDGDVEQGVAAEPDRAGG